MAVDRYFFGIPALMNQSPYNPLYVATAGKDTFIIKIAGQISTVTTPSGGIIKIWGQSVDGDANGTAARVLATLAVEHSIEIDTMIKITAGTRYGCRYDPNGAAGFVGVNFTAVEVGSSTTPSINDIRNYKSADIRNHVGHYYFTANTDQPLNYSINGKQIIQPAEQSSGAVVADQLQVVSTNAADDGDPAGVGARTIKFSYWDSSLVAKESQSITLNGTTAVDLIGTYADVFIFNQAWVVTAGSAGVNAGDILFQDAP